jgi:hypothetical protein
VVENEGINKQYFSWHSPLVFICGRPFLKTGHFEKLEGPGKREAGSSKENDSMN